MIDKKTLPKSKKTFSIRLAPEIMKKIRFLALEEETPLSKLLEEAIDDLIAKYAAKKDKKSR